MAFLQIMNKSDLQRFGLSAALMRDLFFFFLIIIGQWPFLFSPLSPFPIYIFLSRETSE